MILHFLKRQFKFDEKAVDDIFYDIGFFKQYIIHNEPLLDEWYLKNIFTIKYWNYLHNYKWLNSNRLDYLQQGILSLLLFINYQYLENRNRIIVAHIDTINKSLKNFSSHNQKTLKLYRMVKSSIGKVERKMAGDFNSETNIEIYKSITWTLKNIILADKNITVENKDNVHS